MLTNLRFIQSKFWLLNNYLIENIGFLLISSVMVTLAHHKIWCNWRSSCNNFVIVIMIINQALYFWIIYKTSFIPGEYISPYDYALSICAVYKNKKSFFIFVKIL